MGFERDGRARMPEAYRTVMTGIFYLSRLRGKREGWGLRGLSGGEGRRVVGFKRDGEIER